MIRLRRIRRDEGGNVAVEFAMVAPILFTFIFGIAQLGVMFMANTGLRHAVAEGARLASVFPRPLEADIVAHINANRVGLTPSRITGPTVRHVDPATGTSYTEIEMAYSVPLNFIFFETAPVTLRERRIVYTYGPAAPAAASTGSASSTGGAPGTTSASGGPDGGSTTSGGTSTSTSTSTSSTSASTSTSTGGSTGNGNGHGHGNGNGRN